LLVAAACGVDRGDISGDADTIAGGCFPSGSRTVRWIVPTSPGGGQDVLSRLVEPFYERRIGAEIVIENLVGAGGTRGARLLHDADPDGRTIGVINATGRIVAELSGERSGLHPFEDFTVVGRITVEDPVWMVGRDSRFRRVEDLWTRAGGSPVVFGMTDVGGSGFVFVSVAAEILGLEVRYVPGYGGGREYALGLIRGEIDVGGFSFESVRDRVEAGDMLPILQLSDAPVGDHPALAGVPLLAGKDGVAARRAAERGGDEVPAVVPAEALAQLFEFGRIVAAPPGIPEETRRCLADGRAEATADPDLLAAAARAKRTIRFATRDELTADFQVWLNEADWLVPILQRQLDAARRGSSGD